jgi:hypothetical protein
LVVWAAVGLLGLTPGGFASETAQKNAQDLNKSDSSKVSRDSAERAIAWGKLPPDGQAKVRWVLANTSVFRRLPVRMVQCDPALHQFLIQHPDVIVNIWEALGAGRVSMRQVSANVYQTSDETGTKGTMEYLFRSQGLNLAYIDGTYQGALFGQKIRTRGLMLLRSAEVREQDGMVYMVSRLDAFLNIEPGSVEFLSKSFMPIVGKVADNNFLQTAGFLGSVSRSAETNPQGMRRLTKKLTNVAPEVRDEFARITADIGKRAAAAGPLFAGVADDDVAIVPADDEPIRVARQPRRPAAGAAPVATGKPVEPTPSP